MIRHRRAPPFGDWAKPTGTDGAPDRNALDTIAKDRKEKAAKLR